MTVNVCDFPGQQLHDERCALACDALNATCLHTHLHTHAGDANTPQENASGFNTVVHDSALGVIGCDAHPESLTRSSITTATEHRPRERGTLLKRLTNSIRMQTRRQERVRVFNSGMHVCSMYGLMRKPHPPTAQGAPRVIALQTAHFGRLHG